MPSASDRFQAARRRQAAARTEVAAFAQTWPFELDEFQQRACAALEAGRNVLVAAPTGSGKTVVGDFAVHLSLAAGRRAFYTTPIKALSNQKFAELRARHGTASVGLLTGDNAINGDAPVVVMTTEVLRNMIYERSRALDGLSSVVMDEVHYLADRSRGAVWEEVLIQLPPSVAVAALSATVSNAEEFGEWLAEVRGATEVVVTDVRPVPLYGHVMAGRRLYDLFVDDGAGGQRINPSVAALSDDTPGGGGGRRGGRRGYDRRRSGRGRTPSRADVVEVLETADLLPAITFIFSRAGCEAAAEQVAASAVRLTTPAEADRIRTIAETRCAHVPAGDLALLGFASWVAMLSRGIAAHHAGMLPTFKEVVEELFALGLIKCVYATETLALGINMPARSVVLEKLTKWNGTTHADLTPGEYTQLTGRAGRRGIDVEGHAVVLWHEGLAPQALAGLASTRTYPLRSSFRPSYNMAVNLVDNMGRHTAREVLETSFAQFQADRAVVGLAAELRRSEEAAAGYAEAMTCHLGDFAEYGALREQLSRREKESARRSSAAARAQVADSLGQLRRGDVIVLPAGRRTLCAVVVEPAAADSDEPRPQVVTEDRQVRRISAGDLTTPAEPITRMKVPRTFHPRSASSRRDLAYALRDRLKGVEIPHRSSSRRRRGGAGGQMDAELADLRAQLRQHPCHGCDDREVHARWAVRYHRLQREIAGLTRRVESRTNTIARQFDRVCAVLAELGYLTGDDDNARVTDDGRRLARIYNDNDLVAAEAIRLGVWDGLTPAQFAAAASALVFESRGADETAAVPSVADASVRRALADTARIANQLGALERDHRVAFLGTLDPGFAPAALAWAGGEALPRVLDRVDLAPGDFVRWCKQLADFCDQIAVATSVGDERLKRLSTTARQAGAAVRRGVVDYSSEIEP